MAKYTKQNERNFKNHEEYLAWWRDYRKKHLKEMRRDWVNYRNKNIKLHRRRNNIWYRLFGKDWMKEYRKTDAYKISKKKTIAKYPEKKIAYQKYKYALKVGKLIRKPCEVCGKEKSEGHHPDYSKPLDVIWLCNRHHMEIHYPITQ